MHSIVYAGKSIADTRNNALSYVLNALYKSAHYMIPIFFMYLSYAIIVGQPQMYSWSM